MEQRSKREFNLYVSINFHLLFKNQVIIYMAKLWYVWKNLPEKIIITGLVSKIPVLK